MNQQVQTDAAGTPISTAQITGGQTDSSGAYTSVQTGAPNVITLDQLQPQKLLQLPEQNISIPQATASVAGAKSYSDYLKTFTAPPTVEQTQVSSYTKDLQSLLEQTTGQKQALAEEEVKAGVPDLSKQMAQFNADILRQAEEYNVLQKQYEAASQELGRSPQQLSSVVGTQRQELQRSQAAELNMKASEMQLTQARALGLQGQIESAQKTAQKAVDLKYAPVLEQIDIKQKQLKALTDSGILTQQQTIQAEIRQRMYDDEKTKIADEKEKQKTLFNLGITSGVTKPFFEVGGTVVRSSDGKQYSTPTEAAQDGVDINTWSNVQKVTPGGFGNFTKIGETTDDYGTTTDVYGFVDSKTGTVKPLGTTFGGYTSTGNSLVSSNPNPSKVIQGYDFTSYATDPNWGNAVQNISSKIPNLVNPNVALEAPSTGENLQTYIQSVAKNAPVTAQMIFSSANKYGVDPKTLAAIIQLESKFGTLGVGAKTFNPGNVGNTDSGATRNFGSWQVGVDAVAENMSKRVINPQATTLNINNPKSIAQKIFNGTGNLSDVSVKGNLRTRVAAELDRLKQEALSTGDIYGVIRASAGGKDVDATFIQSFEKGVNVLYQITDLQNSIGDEKTGPILGIIRSNNPYDTKAQLIKAQLQAIVPNLARGIYGEVGVLTDNDVANYAKTLPNLKSTEEVRNAILAITLKSVQRSLENKIRTAAGFGRDVSGILDLYKQIENKVKTLEGSLSGQSSGNTDFRSWMSGVNQSSTLDSLLTGQGL